MIRTLAGRLALVLLMSGALFLTAVRSAEAATVSVQGSTLTFVANPGENNQPFINRLPDQSGYTISDRGAPATPGPGCQPGTSQFSQDVVCRGAMTAARLELGDGDDLCSCAGSGLPLNIAAGPGNDTAEGSVGDDVFVGGEGNDGFYSISGDDVVDGGPGNDKLSVALGSGRLSGGDGDDDLMSAGPTPVLDGGRGDDNLEGGDGADRMQGGPGDDKLLGKRGNDTLDAGPGEDDVDGERGDDTITLADGQSDHSLTCGQGNDRLTADGADPVNIDCNQVAGGTLPVGRRDLVTLTLFCPSGCSGTIRLKARGATIGKTAFGGAAAAAVRTSRSAEPAVRLNERGRRLVRARSRLRVSAAITARDRAGRRHNVSARYALRRRR